MIEKALPGKHYDYLEQLMFDLVVTTTCSVLSL